MTSEDGLHHFSVLGWGIEFFFLYIEWGLTREKSNSLSVANVSASELTLVQLFPLCSCGY